VTFIRHGQGFNNLTQQELGPDFNLEWLYDAALTPVGITQAQRIGPQIQSCDLVFVSPLERTIQTALHIINNFQFQSRPTILVEEDLREVFDCSPTCKRKTIAEKRANYQTLDFATVSSNEDPWLNFTQNENFEHTQKRIYRFLQRLWTRNERDVLVVSHGAFLRALFYTLTGITVIFNNCDFHTLTLVNTGHI